MSGHTWVGHYSSALGKLATSQATGNYNYNVSAKMFGQAHVYIATRRSREQMPLVLAYRPGVLTENTTRLAFAEAVEELAKLGVVTQKMIAWPGIPMAAPWAHKKYSDGTDSANREEHGLNGKPHKIPWSYLDTALALPFAPHVNTLMELSGIRKAYITKSGEYGYPNQDVLHISNL